MTSDLNIYKSELILEGEQKVQLMYDRDSDDLEIVFKHGRANCAIELSDNIVLRFDRERKEALSLILISLSYLTQTAEIGPRSFPLTGLEDLPPDLRQTVVEIITTPPVSHFLKVLSLYPSPASSTSTPISYVNLPLALPT